MRRLLLVLVVLAAFSSPAAAESRNKCRQMSKQIAHFYDVKGMARNRGNQLWEKGTERHILQLTERQRKLCPQYLANIEKTKMKIAAEETKALLRAAALAAARYFTFGF